MIFVTVGQMFPFDRMIEAVDRWARARPEEELLAQIGHGTYLPRHMRWTRKLDQDAFAATVAGARLIVAHAGMGSVITAGQYGKPIVILPRLAGRGEHNSDHQVATAGWLRDKPGIHVAESEDDLPACIEAASSTAAGPPQPIPSAAPPEFLARIRVRLLEETARGKRGVLRTRRSYRAP